jgi:hypothetical protein
MPAKKKVCHALKSGLLPTGREKIYVPSPSAAGRKEGPDFGNSERQVHRGARSGKLGKTREERGEKKRLGENKKEEKRGEKGKRGESSKK